MRLSPSTCEAMTSAVCVLRRPKNGAISLNVSTFDQSMGGSEAMLLRSFGSAGQQRSAAVALRLVEAETLRAARGRRPIVMLDDVFAELDPRRAERVVELFTAEEWGQVFVTSPKPSEIAVMGDSLVEYRVVSGTVKPA